MKHIHRGKVAAFGALSPFLMPSKVLRGRLTTLSALGGMGLSRQGAKKRRPFPE